MMRDLRSGPDAPDSRREDSPMKVIALEHGQPGATSTGNGALLEKEARAIWDLTQAGLVREIYFRSDTSAAVIVLEAASVDDARDILSRLPLVRDGRIEFEVIGLRPYPGYERLFAG
jgi:hypothetical protein